MKSLRKILGIVLVVGMLAAMMVPAFAGSSPPPVGPSPSPRAEHKYEGDDSVHVPESEKYLTDVNGGKVQFKKFLVIPKGTQVPNAEFTFTIESGVGVSATDTTMEVYPGSKALSGTLPVFTTNKNKATFAPGDTTYDAVRTDANGEIDVDVKREASDRKTGLSAATGVQWESGKEVYAVVEDLEIDFTGVTFVEPGIYRYIIRETASTTNEAAGIMHDNHTFRILDVYVTDTNNKPDDATHPEGKLHVGLYDDQHSNTGVQITGYVLHKGGTAPDYIENPTVKSGTDKGSADVASHGAKLGDKTDGFTNEYKPYNLVIAKQVTGNQASRDKYFKYTVTLSGLSPNGVYNVSYKDDKDPDTLDGYADQTISANPNLATTCITADVTQPATITADANGAATVTFYLQHEQRIAILGLPATAKYTVAEAAEDYESTGAAATLSKVPDAAGDYKNLVSSGNNTIAEVDKTDRDGSTSVYTEDNTTTPATVTDNRDHVVYTSFLSTRDGVIPTGVIMTVAPGAAIILIAGIGFAVLMASKRKREEEAAE